MVSTTRSMSCFTEYSRSGEPMAPRKYLEATTFVASCDQSAGTSMLSCSNTDVPSPDEMPALRRSHSRRSYGCLPFFVK